VIAKRKTLQELIEARQQVSFVGRRPQVAQFESNIALPVDERSYIFNIFGNAGVGKTYLLQRYLQIARSRNAATAQVDEAADLPSVLKALADQLGDTGLHCKAFLQKYQHYLKRRAELETDPDAPAGVAGALASAAVSVGLSWVGVETDIPVLDSPEFGRALAERAGEWTSYVNRKWGNRDDTALLLSPSRTLTSAFVSDLTAGENKAAIVLGFDTYERNEGVLDKWLRQMLRGDYGGLPPNVVVLAAGQSRLSSNSWAHFESVMVRVHLQEFAEEEVREYLARHGIVDEQVIELVRSLSGQLPLLVATMAASQPNHPGTTADVTGTALERFLMNEEPDRRELALRAATPRRLNRDVLVQLSHEYEEKEGLFDWLEGLPFVIERGDGWEFHQTVRAQMLRHLRKQSPRDWLELHQALAAHYEREEEALHLEGRQAWKNSTWQRAALERTYHQLCANPDAKGAEAIHGYLVTLRQDKAMRWSWAKTIQQAGEDSAHDSLIEWGRRLASGEGLEGAALKEAELDILNHLLSYRELSDKDRRFCLLERATGHVSDRAASDAIADLSAVVDDAPEDGELWLALVLRATSYVLAGDTDRAIADLDTIIDRGPEELWPSVLGMRGEIRRRRDGSEKALEDFDLAVELFPKNPSPYVSRGRQLLASGLTEKGLADFKMAVEVGASAPWTLEARASALLRANRPGEAVEEFGKLLRARPQSVAALSGQSEAFKRLKQYAKALEAIEKALAIKQDDEALLYQRSAIYLAAQQNEDAVTGLSALLERSPGEVPYLRARADAFVGLQRYDLAIDDLNAALVSSPESDSLLLHRGDVHHLSGRFVEAERDFDRAVALRPDDAATRDRRATFYSSLGRDVEALKEFDRIAALAPRRASSYRGRGEFYASCAATASP
jgi:tetratricopeptide (TPR) repeat protein/GTPase SAR1 family protein